jgi:hypothetical protein
MIQGYQPPELLIRQSFQNTDSTTRERLSALVIGPQYTWPDPETDTLEKVEVSADTLVYDLTFTDSDGIAVTSTEAEGWRVDSDSVQAYIEGAEYSLHTSASVAGTAELTLSNQLRLSKILRSTGSGLDADFKGRDIQVGDLVYITETTTQRKARRKVTGFLGEVGDGSYTTIANFGSNPIATSATGITKFSAPSNVTTITGGTSVLSLSDPLKISDYLAEGFRFTDADGNVRAGTKATIKVLSYTTGAGTAVVSFEDGLTANQIVNFTFAGGAMTFASGSIERVATGAALVVTYATGAPAPGDRIVVTVTIAYETAVAHLSVTDEGNLPSTSNRFYAKVKVGTSIAGSVGDYTYGDAVVTVYDRLGLVPATDVDVPAETDTDIPIGSTGLTLVILSILSPALDQIGLRTGDIYYTDFTAPTASNIDYDGVILDGPAALGNAASQTLSVKFRRSAAGEFTALDFADSVLPVTLDAELGQASLENTIAWTKYVSAFGDGYKYPTIVSNADGVTPTTVYVTWRASKIPVASEGVLSIASASDLALLGKLDPRNDLAFGAYAAMQGSVGKTIYAIRTAGPEVEDFAETLEKVARQDYTYALAALTTNKDIGKLVALHCEAMSEEDVKNFRRAYFGVDSPGDYLVVDKTIDDAPYTATVTAYSGGNLRVSFEEAIDLNALGILAGDYVVIDGTSYTINSILPDGNELILKTGPAFPYTSPVELTVWRKDTADSQASYVENVAKYINSRRSPVVWVDGGTTYDGDGNLVQIPVRFTAAFLAGLRSNTTPWLGLSRAAVSFLVSAAPMYLKYSRELLNRVASNGVFIVTQAVESGPVYVRHQLTSDVSHGSLAYEDSIGTNVDDLSFQFKDAFEPLIGITNVTPETLRVAEQRGTSILVEARTSETDPLIGPQIIQFFNALGEPGAISVAAHPRFKDRIIAKAQVEVPLPNNTTIIELTAVSGITI